MLATSFPTYAPRAPSKTYLLDCCVCCVYLREQKQKSSEFTATVPGAVNMGRSAGHGRRPGRRGNMHAMSIKSRPNRARWAITPAQSQVCKPHCMAGLWVQVVLSLGWNIGINSGGASRYKETGTNLDQDLMRQLRGMCISWSESCNNFNTALNVSRGPEGRKNSLRLSPLRQDRPGFRR